jgi:hypothetical protein
MCQTRCVSEKRYRKGGPKTLVLATFVCVSLSPSRFRSDTPHLLCLIRHGFLKAERKTNDTEIGGKKKNDLLLDISNGAQVVELNLDKN